MQNKQIRELHERWKFNADLMTCQECGYSVIATRMAETPHHAAGCKHAGEQNPWLQLAEVLQALKVGAGGTAVTREMLTAAHGVTLESGDVVLSARLLERIYMAMEQAAPPPKTPFDICPTCEALARTVMMDQTGAA